MKLKNKKYKTRMDAFYALSKVVTYNPFTGEILWNIKSKKHQVGKQAGYSTNGTYIRIGFDHRKFFAHRIAWYLYYGIVPDRKLNIDHSDGCKTNNRINNLRLVTQSENLRNQKIHRNGGTVGVLFHSRHKKWQALLPRVINGKKYAEQKYLGFFNTEHEAIEVVRKAMAELDEII